MPANFQILFVDDDQDDQFILRSSFEQVSKQIKITSLYSGPELLSFLASRNKSSGIPKFPDAIILDINMPGMTGLEVLEKIKGDTAFKNIPVFMLSTLRTIQRVDRSIELGAIQYFSKPNSSRDYDPICREILENSIFHS